jgi:tetratricopeptide (TPR) repeat protein
MTLFHSFAEKHKEHESYKEYIALNDLANLYSSQDRWDEAEPLYSKALSLCRHLYENSLTYCTRLELVTSINKLADLYLAQECPAKAELLYIEVIELCRCGYENWFWYISSVSRTCFRNKLKISLNQLADLYLSQNRWDEAKHLYIEALRLEEISERYYSISDLISIEALKLERLYIDYDMSDLKLVNYLNKLAHSYHSQEIWELAESLYHRAFKICHYLYADHHSNILATILNNLADFYHARKNYFDRYRDIYFSGNPQNTTSGKSAFVYHHRGLFNSIFSRKETQNESINSLTIWDRLGNILFGLLISVIARQKKLHFRYNRILMFAIQNVCKIEPVKYKRGGITDKSNKFIDSTVFKVFSINLESRLSIENYLMLVKNFMPIHDYDRRYGIDTA